MKLSFGKSVFALLCCMMIFIPSLGYGKDKRTPITILPQGQSNLDLVFVNMDSDSTQYLINGQFASKSENTTMASKVIARGTYFEDLEFCLEVPWIVNQRANNTNARGMTVYTDNEGGLGDMDFQVTYQWLDVRKKSLGLITGVEVKLPTGDEENGLGTGSVDLIFRSAVSKQTKIGLPYLMALYTCSGDGNINGVGTDFGDDLYLASGLRSVKWYGFSLDVRGYMYVRTTGLVKESFGSQVFFEKYNIPGFKTELRYLLNQQWEFCIAYEVAYPREHNYRVNDQSFTKDPDGLSYTMVQIKFIW